MHRLDRLSQMRVDERIEQANAVAGLPRQMKPKRPKQHQMGQMPRREYAAWHSIAHLGHHMVALLTEYFGTVEACDVHDYGVGIVVSDFLFPGDLPLVDLKSPTRRSAWPSSSSSARSRPAA
ncbi:hypothetical protein U1872_18335 [Sphingomonas sp. RB3P16]|uniref:hypothetical protein n=1 Tax=Parasphingomonas frigoris TaxID=3096163 RepID=UPI002FC7BEAD